MQEKWRGKLIGNRVPYIDIAKGITIFLVIVGHAANNLDDPFYRLVLYYFHMPLFFMLTGMSIRPKTAYNAEVWKKMIRKNAVVLMVPYFLWGTMYATFSFFNIGRLAFGSWKALGKAETLTSLWYIPCLFLVRIEIHLLFQLFRKIKANIYVLSTVAAVISFAIGFLLPYNEVRGYMWCADISFVALGFVLIGFVTKGLFEKICEWNMCWQAVGAVISAAGLFAGTWLQRGKAFTLVLMCDNVYGNLVLFFWNTVFGSLLVLFVSMMIAKYAATYRFAKALIYIGQNTFAIYLLHKPILQKLAMGFFGLFGFDAFDFWIVVVASVITLWVCIWAMRAIAIYLPQFLGKFPEPNVKVVQSAEEA